MHNKTPAERAARVPTIHIISDSIGETAQVVARAAAPGALHHRKTMLPAQFVGRFAHRAVAGGVSVEAPAVGEGHRVDHEVVVEVGLVQMGGHHNLEAAAHSSWARATPTSWAVAGSVSPGANAWYPWKATMPPVLPYWRLVAFISSSAVAGRQLTPVTYSCRSVLPGSAA